MRTQKTLYCLCMVSSLALCASEALAQSPVVGGQDQPPESRAGSNAAAPSGAGEIIVTARKRAETAISVPVTITAVGGAELARRGVNNLEGIARLVPSLNIAEGGGTIQGGTVSLRGIAGPDTNPLGDQAVSFVVDNVQIAKASVRRLGSFDIAQVEVLKGPQTLFFGKNSPGGIIAMTTADPTDSLAAKLSAGYEFNAHEFRTEGYVSGPLTETLGGRLAFYTSDMRGWVKNISERGLPESPIHDYGPRNHEFGLRGTLVWNPTDSLDVRLKASYGRARGAGPGANMQYIVCPYGAPQYLGVVDECKANDKVAKADLGKSFAPFDSRFEKGVGFQRANQQLISLDANYELSDRLKLTSVTGFYRIKYNAAENYGTGATASPLPGFLGTLFGRPAIVAGFLYYDREISEEVRLQSDLGGIFDFTVGGLYQDTATSTDAHTFANPDAPVELGEFLYKQKGTAYSFFAQGVVRPAPQVEISGGGRFSHEEKKLPLVLIDLTGNGTAPGVPVLPNPDKIKFNNFSPEVTASYRPNTDLTLYGSYKRGFLSGGFNAIQQNFADNADVSYGPQKVKGFEVGLKAALFDRRLRLNLAAYTYKIAGLQVTAIQQTASGSPLLSIKNAGHVSVKGLEGDLSFEVVRGLSLQAAASYNRGRYEEYFAPCYSGQSAAEGCNLIQNGGSVQDLAGTKLRNAPTWALSGGFSYDTAISADLKIGVSTNVSYTSSEITDSKSTPGAVSPRRALVDGTVRLAQADDRWELALIGRNLTDRYYWATSQEVGFTGNFIQGNPRSDQYAVPSRGREVMIRATVKFGQ